MLSNIELEQSLQLLNALDDPLLLLDGEGRLHAANPALDQLVGGDFAASQGLKPAECGNRLLQMLAEANGLIQILAGEDQPLYYRVREISAPGSEDPAARAILFHDVTETETLRAQAERTAQALKEQTLKEPVTGLLNQRGLMLALEPQVSRSRRYGNPLALITITLPQTAVSEATLKLITQELKDQLRWADLIAYAESGDFVVVLPETGLAAATQLVQKLTVRITEIAGFEQPAVSGVAEWQKSDSAASLLKRGRVTPDGAGFAAAS